MKHRKPTEKLCPKCGRSNGVHWRILQSLQIGKGGGSARAWRERVAFKNPNPRARHAWKWGRWWCTVILECRWEDGVVKRRRPIGKVWPKCRRGDGILLRNPAIIANCSKAHAEDSEQKRQSTVRRKNVQMEGWTFARLESTLAWTQMSLLNPSKGWRRMNDKICAREGMMGIVKKRRRENVPPRQRIFRLPSTRAPCCWRGGEPKYYSRTQRDMRMSAIVDRQEVVVIRRCWARWVTYTRGLGTEERQ